MLALDFADTAQAAPLSLVLGGERPPVDVAVKAPVGELVQPVTMTSSEFRKHQARLTGMNENSAQVRAAD